MKSSQCNEFFILQYIFLTKTLKNFSKFPFMHFL